MLQYFPDPEAESEWQRQQQARRDKRTCQSNYQQLQEQTTVDPTLLNNERFTYAEPSVSISGNNNCSVVARDELPVSLRVSHHLNTMTLLSYFYSEVNNEYESSYWGGSKASHFPTAHKLKLTVI